MATRIVHVDDIDGSEDASTVRFALAQTTYEIDLSSDNLEKLQTALQPFIDAAHEVGKAPASSRRSRQSGGTSRPSGELEVIREWARANGHKVGSKGRISRTVQEAYDAANG